MKELFSRASLLKVVKPQGFLPHLMPFNTFAIRYAVGCGLLRDWQRYGEHFYEFSWPYWLFKHLYLLKYLIILGDVDFDSFGRGFTPQ